MTAIDLEGPFTESILIFRVYLIYFGKLDIQTENYFGEINLGRPPKTQVQLNKNW